MFLVELIYIQILLYFSLDFCFDIKASFVLLYEFVYIEARHSQVKTNVSNSHPFYDWASNSCHLDWR